MASPDSSYQFERFMLDLRRGCLLGPDGEIELRPKSFELLRVLAENAGRLVGKDEIIRAVWLKAAVSDDSLAQCISEVRRALGDGQQRLIRTVPRRGYRLVPPVSRESIGAVAAAKVAEPAAGMPAASRVEASSHQRGHTFEPAGAGHGGWRRSAERRLLTVLSCELVGAAGPAFGMDPEDIAARTDRFHEFCGELAARHGGYACRNLNEALIYYGYPIASEHDAEHAVRTGMALLEAAGRLSDGGTVVRLRVGVASGIAVIDGEGDSEPMRQAGLGAPPHLARRLQAVAAAGELLIAESTRALVGRLFRYRDLGQVVLDDHLDPIRVWSVIEPRRELSRFEALRPADRSTLVGREEEIDLLLRRWRRAAEGDGQAVLLGGEPGIGKSRLVDSLLEQLVAEPHFYLRFDCSPDHGGSPLHPIVQRLECTAGFAANDRAGVLRDKLHRLLAATSTPREDEVLFAGLLSVPQQVAGAWPELPPPERRRRTVAALLRWLEAQARQRPLLVVFEDVHWIDPCSLDMLGFLIERVAELCALVVVTFRPGFTPSWLGMPQTTLLSLNRLPPQNCRRLIEEPGDAGRLRLDLVEDIVRRSDGLPLFVEELTRAARADGGSQDATRMAGSGRLSAVPASLTTLLTSRLDRLGPAREIAQIGAAIGHRFSFALLETVASAGEPELTQALERLIDDGILRTDFRSHDASFVFNHALIRDAAYAMLSRQDRCDLHARIAGVLEQRFPETAANRPEILAEHCFEAGRIEATIAYLGRAGELALDRAAFADAAFHLGRAIEHVDSAAQAGTPVLATSVRLGLQSAYGRALHWAKGIGV